MGLIIAILTAFGGFLVFMRGLTGIGKLTCLGGPDLYVVSREVDLLIIVGGLTGAWLLGLAQKGTFTFSRIGTGFYGHTEREGGYVATKWLMLLFPVLPIRSYLILAQVRERSVADFESQEFVTAPIPGYFDWAQVFYTASVAYGTILWSAGCLWLMLNSACMQLR